MAGVPSTPGGKPLEELNEAELTDYLPLLREYLLDRFKTLFSPFKTSAITAETKYHLQQVIVGELLEIFKALQPEMVKVHVLQDEADPTALNIKFDGPPWLLSVLGLGPRLGPLEEYPSEENYQRGQINRSILTLAPRETHGKHQDCPMHLVPTPDGNWMCLECGCTLLMKRIQLTAQMYGLLERRQFWGEPAIKPKLGDIREEK